MTEREMKMRCKSVLSCVLGTVRRPKEPCLPSVWPHEAYSINVLRMERSQPLEEGTSFQVYRAVVYFQLYELGLRCL